MLGELDGDQIEKVLRSELACCEKTGRFETR